jgi:hypothetical protein
MPAFAVLYSLKLDHWRRPIMLSRSSFFGL